MNVFVLTITTSNCEVETTTAATRAYALDLAEAFAREHWAALETAPIEELATQDEILETYFGESDDEYAIEEMYLHGWEHEVAALLVQRFPWVKPSATHNQLAALFGTLHELPQAMHDWHAELSSACLCALHHADGGVIVRGEGKHHQNCPAWDGHAGRKEGTR